MRPTPLLPIASLVLVFTSTVPATAAPLTPPAGALCDPDRPAAL